MANMNIRTPVFYPDRIRHQNARGGSIASIISGSGFIGFESGSIGTLHNGKPLDLCSFNTTGDPDGHILLNYNMGASTWSTTFVTILNHNLVTSQAKIRIFFGDSASDVQDQGNADEDLGSVTATEIVNAGTIAIGGNKSVHVQPTSDGTTIVKIVNDDGSDFSNQRYVAVQIEGNASASSNTGNFDFNGSTNVTIGGIEIGEIYTMPFAPDLSVKRSIIYDKVSIQESVGGQRYSTTTSFGRFASATSRSPFTSTIYQQFTHGGRIAYDLSFSYLQSTDTMPNEYSTTQFTDDSFVGDVWNITDGNFHPFVFSIDSESTGSNAESEFIYARFAQDTLDMDQVANDFFSLNLKIEEEF